MIGLDYKYFLACIVVGVCSRSLVGYPGSVLRRHHLIDFKIFNT